MELTLKLLAVFAMITGAIFLVIGITTPQPGSDNILVVDDSAWLISMGLFIGIVGPPIFLYNARVVSRIRRLSSEESA